MKNWEEVPETWKKIMQQAFPDVGNLQKDKLALQTLLKSPTLRIVGPHGIHPSIDFNIDNIEGIQLFSEVEFLFISFTDVVDISPLSSLKNLKSLFINNNRITRLAGLESCVEIENLFVNDNNLTSTEEVHNLVKLKQFSCAYNDTLQSFEGIHEGHTECMEKFIGLPNSGIPLSEIKRVEDNCGIRVWRG